MITTVTGLRPSTTYFIQVAAVNDAGTGVHSTFEIQRTDGKDLIYTEPQSNTSFSAPDVILLLSIIPSSSTTLIISWALEDAVMVESYTISYSNTDTDCFIDSSTITSVETSYALTGLEEGTEYSITVTAILTGVSVGEADGMSTTMAAG